MILDKNGRPMVSVHSCNKEVEASLVVSYLSAYGIRAQANSDIPHSILPVSVGKLSKLRVLVSEDDAEEACMLLAEAHQGRLVPEEDA